MPAQMYKNDQGCLCVLCVFLYLMTRWLCDTAKAGATHLSQWRPIAQRLVHGIDNATICLCTWPDRTEQSNTSSFIADTILTHTHTPPSTHRGLSRIKEWRPQTRWLVILRCFESACVSITHPGQQEPPWPHPAHQCWAEESWSFSWKLPSDRDGETGEERGRRNVTWGAKTTKGRCNILV